MNYELEKQKDVLAMALSHNLSMVEYANQHEKSMACELAKQPLDNIKDIYTIMAMMKECGEMAMLTANAHTLANTPKEHMQANGHTHEVNSHSLYKRMQQSKV